MHEPIIQNRLNTESLYLLNHKNIKNKAKVIILGDSHLNSYGWNELANRYELDVNGKKYLKILNHITKHHGDSLFVIHGGDTIDSSEQKEESIKAFVNCSKEILFKENIPLFVSIGDTEYSVEGKEIGPKLFLKYIGDEVNKIDIQDTHLSFINMNPFLFKNSYQFLNYHLQKDINHHYLIDFHIPLKFNQLETFYNNNPVLIKQNLLSTKQTEKLMELFNEHTLAIFNHHLHLSDVYRYQHILYLLTSNAGNKNSSPYPNYFVLELDDLYHHPKITNYKAEYVL